MPPNAMYRFSTVANVSVDPSRFSLLECMEQIEPDNPKDICYKAVIARVFLVFARLTPMRPIGCGVKVRTTVKDIDLLVDEVLCAWVTL